MGTRIAKQLGKSLRLKQVIDARSDVGKTWKHNTHAILEQPLGVVALLRHGSCVALNDYGKIELQSFADAARSGLPDEKVGKGHEIVHVRSKSLSDNAGFGL